MSNPLRILQIVQTLDPSVGGVAPAVLCLSGGLVRRGHKVDVVTLDEPNASYLSHRSDLVIHALGNGLTSYRYSANLAKWLRQHGDNYDHAIVNGLWQYLSFATWRQYARASIPYYVFPHGMLDPWFKRTFPFKHLKKWLYWPWADYRVLRDAAAVIFTSEEERLQARKSFWLYRCRERVSPLGIEAPPISPLSKEKFLSRYPSLRDKRIFLFLGRLHPKKGCDILLDGFAQSAANREDFFLVIGGPDQIGWQQQLQQRAGRLGIAGRVLFTGLLQGELKEGAFAAAESFILPSHQENFGMSVVEALSMGLPVLISNRVNIWQEVTEDRAGYVEKDDLAGTARLIERWTNTPASVRETMRANARSCFACRFELDHAIDALLSILNERT